MDDCRLDSFVKYLQSSGCFEQEVIADVIVKNYNNRYNSEYKIDGTTYIVNTLQERQNLKYDFAEDRFYEAIDYLENKINETVFDSFDRNLYLTLIHLIPDIHGTNAICNLIDYEDEFDCEKVYTDKYYNIYRIN